MSSCAESEPYALQVHGDSMEPEFPDGVVVVVEKTPVVEDGHFVIAKMKDGYTLRQLKIENGHWFLVALNEAYPTVEIEGIKAIHGRIIQRSARRRRDRKSYL
ncbi:MAG: peptidase [Acidiferrobacteraceae bacterium]|nr:peptidase [Acidiferrobacteraceae bacterium]MDP6434709.1 S24 family peptidase [Arenicellales bacterium]MDP6671432.1 S24 family peptidase [Arenicellales bacterium]MDP6724340.1 S24 family peptidase [Arenicellales bacterium]